MDRLRDLLAAGCLAALVAAATTGSAQTRNDLVLGLQLEPPHLDPTSAAAGAIDQVLYANVFEGLTRFGPDGSINSGVARDWEISEDGLVYVFRLQPGIRFHDGTALEASDVKFTLDRARDEGSQNAQKALFEGIDTVEVVDDLTVKVTLKAPNGNFLFNMAWGDAVIVAPESIADIKHKPVGTGAFMFEDWVQGDHITLIRNPDYWGPPAKLDKVTFKFISDPTAAYAAVMAEDVQAFPGFPAPENLPQFEADPRFQVLYGTTEGETILAINNKAEPLNRLLVRKAIAHAINRQEIIDGAMFGLGTPIGTHFAPHHPAYVDLTALSRYDPDLSRRLLAEAGFPEGFETTLKLPPPAYARRGGEIIAAQLRAVGIEARITNLEWAQWLEEVFRGKDYGLTIVSHTEPFDIGIYARPDYYFQYDSPEFQSLNAALTAETDPAKRAKILAQMQRRIAEDYVNAYLFQLAIATVADARLRGLWKDAPTQATDVTGVYWAN